MMTQAASHARILDPLVIEGLYRGSWDEIIAFDCPECATGTMIHLAEHDGGAREYRIVRRTSARIFRCLPERHARTP